MFKKVQINVEAGQVTPNETSLQISRCTMWFGYASKSALYIYLKTHNNQISVQQGTMRCQEFLVYSKLWVPSKQGVVIKGSIYRAHQAWRNPRYCGCVPTLMGTRPSLQSAKQLTPQCKFLK